jgi:thiol-disulfide isomerase/thioredoxin
MSHIIAYQFSSPTCEPCKAIKPSIADLKEEFDTIQWVHVNTHNDPEKHSQRFDITHVPSIVLMNATTGAVISKYTGTEMSIYYSILRKALKT